MGSGILQLSAYGKQNLFLTEKPQITFFKVIYKRHTNFALESIPQFFNIKPDFGNRVTCTISKIGDLIGKIYLFINLPPIGKFIDIPNESGIGNSNIACCAWTKNIGFQLIKQVELEIGGIIIDRHYSDWLNIYHDITVVHSKQKSLNNMIGNIDYLTDLTSSKQSCILYIPLIFWFNRYPNLALPLISLYNTDIKLNIEFNSIINCLIIGPTHYIIIDEYICLFKRGDIICQNVNSMIYYMKFVYYDYTTQKLYYIKITPEIIDSQNIIYSVINPSYYVTPSSETIIEKLYYNLIKYAPQILNLGLGNSYLYIDYIFLDSAERLRFGKNKHEYLIDTLTFDNDKILYYANNKIKINYALPCKEIIFRCNYNYFNNYILDIFNYTTNIYDGEDIINTVLILMNGQQRFTIQENNYFNQIQPFLYHTKKSSKGINIYSFSINPEKFQPSGYCNFSKIDDIEININIDNNVSYIRPVYFRVYGLIYNILKISDGICSTLF